MKANEAPERIWINSPQDLPCGFVDKNSVEYFRTDAFVEKTCEWLEENADMFEAFDSETKTYYMDKNAMIEKFKKAMKGK